MEIKETFISRPILRIMGKRGRSTIPWEIRQQLGLQRGDILKYRADSLGRVIVTKEKLCDHCADVKTAPMEDFPAIPPELAGITLPELNKIYAGLIKRLGLI